MVRIKAETTAAIALAPTQSYRHPQQNQCNNYYGFYSPATTYQQSCPTHVSTQQLNEVLGEVWTAASGYQDWAKVSSLKMNLCLENLFMTLNFISVLNRLVFLFLFISCDLWMSLVLTCRLMRVRTSLAPSLIKRLLFSSLASSTDEPLRGWLHSSFCFQTVPPTQPQVALFYPLMSWHFMMSSVWRLLFVSSGEARVGQTVTVGSPSSLPPRTHLSSHLIVSLLPHGPVKDGRAERCAFGVEAEERSPTSRSRLPLSREGNKRSVQVSDVSFFILYYSQVLLCPVH